MKKTKTALSTFILSAVSCACFAAPTEITIWHHQTSPTEMDAVSAMVKRFNDSQDNYKVVETALPKNNYTQIITGAALTEELPCIVSLDQPLIPKFAKSGYFQPLEGYVDDSVLNEVNTSGKGTYEGKVYSIGQFDVALSLFTTKSLLKKIDARTPTVDEPWTGQEFMEVLDKIKATSQYKYALDIEAGNSGEWVPYAWSPMMISWGADLIDRDNNTDVDGILNSTEAIEFSEWLYRLVTDGYIDRNSTNIDSFLNGTTAIHYTGSWAVGRLDEKFGDDLAILPVPDFGHGPSIGGGSWHWALTKSCKSPEAAAAFLNHLASTEEIAAMSNATSVIPTSEKAAALTDNYQTNGKWRAFYEFSESFAKLRPETPMYAAISNTYSVAMHSILDGEPPQEVLSSAVSTIEDAIEKDDDYEFLWQPVCPSPSTEHFQRMPHGLFGIEKTTGC